jgi:ABC-type multidrug transport system fused ATPase/permease subunit
MSIRFQQHPHHHHHHHHQRQHRQRKLPLQTANLANRRKKSKRQGSNDDDDNDRKAKDDEAEVKLPPVAFFSLYRYCTAGEKLLLVVSIICALAVGAAQPLFMILFGGSISSIGGAGTIDQDIILNFVYLGVGMGVAGFLTSFCGTMVSNRLCDRVRLFYVRALLRQEIGWYDSQSTGKLVARVSGDIDLVQEGLNRVTMIFQALATFVGGFVVGFIKSWQLSLVIVACAPLLIGIGAFIGRLMAQMARQGQEAFADSIAIATEALGAVRLVHAFGGERQERALYDADVDKGTKETVGRMKFNGIGIGLALLIMQLIQSLALWYGSTLLADGSLDDVGNVFVALFAILIGAMSLGMIGEPLASLATARGVAAALYDVIDRRSDIDATTDESALRSAKGVRGRIEFRDVRFSYPTRPEVEVLKGLSFVVEPGKSLALIGKSGSGKSTSVGLIERWYRPTAGQVLIDDVPIEQYGVGSLRNRIALVSQEPVLFARSIRDNILLGAIADDPSAPVPTEEQMIRAAKRANCHDFITQLPQGYDTMVGEKSAARLSGGQKQRIAIARALIRDPVILLLDESTSALDTASERLVQDALNEISRTLTTITIAHRLSTIRDSSEIIFLQNGVVVERGTHEQLLERDGLYAMQHKAQGARRARGVEARRQRRQGAGGPRRADRQRRHGGQARQGRQEDGR